jgi:shikimate dehydrogenase
VTTRAAVLGHPISHSLSPALHNAAYEALGVDWHYEAIDVDEPALEGFLASCGDEWGGLSLTMPLKVEGARLADFVEPQAKLLGVVNTLMPSGRGEYRQWVGANTDIHGIAEALGEGGCSAATRGVVLGGGATAASAVAALGALGVKQPAVVVRSRSRAGGLVRAATKMGLSPRLVAWDDPAVVSALADADAVVSTVPADAGEGVGERLAAAGVTVRGVLLDVVYKPRVSPLALRWKEASGTAVDGTRMLLHQAGEQVRLMTGKPAPLSAMEAGMTAVLNNS